MIWKKPSTCWGLLGCQWVLNLTHLQPTVTVGNFAAALHGTSQLWPWGRYISLPTWMRARMCFLMKLRHHMAGVDGIEMAQRGVWMACSSKAWGVPSNPLKENCWLYEGHEELGSSHFVTLSFYLRHFTSNCASDCSPHHQKNGRCSLDSTFISFTSFSLSFFAELSC